MRMISYRKWAVNRRDYTKRKDEDHSLTFILPFLYCLILFIAHFLYDIILS